MENNGRTLEDENQWLRREVSLLRAMPPTVVVGKFQPSSLNVRTIAEEFDEFMQVNGFAVDPDYRYKHHWPDKDKRGWYLYDHRIEVRKPGQHYAAGSIPCTFHYDLKAWSYRIAVWATHNPAEFQIQRLPIPSDDSTPQFTEPFHYEPYDVVVFNNAVVMHRQPAMVSPARWSLRAINICVGRSNIIRDFAAPKAGATVDERLATLEWEMKRSFKVIAKLHLYMAAAKKGLVQLGMSAKEAAEYAHNQRNAIVEEFLSEQKGGENHG